MERQLRWMINYLVMLFPVIALLISHSSSIFLVLFAVAGIAVAAVHGRRIGLNRPEKSILWAFAMFPAAYLISFAVNALQGDLLDPGLKHLGDELRMLLMVPIYLLFRQVRIAPFYLWNGIVIAALAAGINAMYRYLWLAPGLRVSGSYDPIAFGDVSLVLGMMSLASFDTLAARHRIYKWVVPAAFFAGMTASLLSATRGAWIAIPAMMIILFFYMHKYVSLVHRLCLVAVCLLVGIGLYLVPATNVATRVQEVVQEVTDYLQGDVQYGGATYRILGWRATGKIFRAHPVIGAGPGNYKPLVDQMVARGELHEMTARHSQPGSTFLMAAADCGLLGLITLMGIFLVPLWLSIRWIRNNENQVEDIGYALLMLAVAFLHFGNFEAIFRRSFFTNFYIIMVAALTATAFNAMIPNHSSNRIKKRPEVQHE
ncbi:MAG TPA: O-antigen ligase family protein [Desulfobacterales bacterium]